MWSLISAIAAQNPWLVLRLNARANATRPEHGVARERPPREALFAGIDLPSLGYRVTEAVQTELATHLVLTR